MSRNSLRYARTAGVTLLELLTVIIVIGILATILFPVVTNMIQRMERSQCSMNLRSLVVATEAYIQDNHQWPQIDTTLMGDGSTDDYDRAWIAALTPYKISEQGWHCPTVQKAMSQAVVDSSQPVLKRIDYFPTPFDEKEITPHRWTTQPWFIERGTVHGNGNLIIFMDGSIKELGDLLTPVTQ